MAACERVQDRLMREYVVFWVVSDGFLGTGHLSVWGSSEDEVFTRFVHAFPLCSVRGIFEVS